MGTLTKMEEREGCPIKEGALPGVSAHDAETSSVRLVVRDVHGIEIGLNPAWLEFGVGLTPLLHS